MKHAMRRSARCSSFRSVHSGIARTSFPWHVVAGLGLRRLWQDQLFLLGFIVKVTQTSQILRTLVKGSTSTTLGRGFGALQCVSRCRPRDKYGYRLVQVWVFRRGHTFSKYYFDAFEGSIDVDCWARRLSRLGCLWSHCGELPTAFPRKGTGPTREIPPPRQGGGGTKAPAVTYVATIGGVVVHVVVSVCWRFCSEVLSGFRKIPNTFEIHFLLMKNTRSEGKMPLLFA